MLSRLRKFRPARGLLVMFCVLLGWGFAALPEQRNEIRQSRRAYDGAPPIIPHDVDTLGRRECLKCHLSGLDLGKDGLAATTPHPELKNCRQCHLAQVERRPLVSNSFEGARYPALGIRPFPGAPPTIPHPLQMRTNCLSCHGPKGGAPVRTSHADRKNCQQCHLPSSAD